MHEQRGVALFIGRAARLRQPRQPQGGLSNRFYGRVLRRAGVLVRLRVGELRFPASGELR